MHTQSIATVTVFSSPRPTHDHRNWQLCPSMIKSSMMETRHEGLLTYVYGIYWNFLDPSHSLWNRERELQRQRYPWIHRTGFKHWLLPYRHCSMWFWILTFRSLILIFCLLRRVRKWRKHPYRHSGERTDQVRVVYHNQVLEWQPRGGNTGEFEQGAFSLFLNYSIEIFLLYLARDKAARLVSNPLTYTHWEWRLWEYLVRVWAIQAGRINKVRFAVSLAGWLSLNYCFRSIGVSNFTLEDIQKLLKTAHVKPAVNQVSLSSPTDHCDRELIPMMTDWVAPI